MVLSKKYGSLLIFVSCFTYSIAYLGRLSYAANLTAIAEAYSVSKESLGTVSSMLFFCVWRRSDTSLLSCKILSAASYRFSGNGYDGGM